MNDELQAGANPAAREDFLRNLWEEHMRHEFATRDTEETLATMVDDAYVNHIPVLTGGVGKDALREFYSKRFIPQMPPDTEVTPVSRTIGPDQLVDEMLFDTVPRSRWQSDGDDSGKPEHSWGDGLQTSPAIASFRRVVFSERS